MGESSGADSSKSEARNSGGQKRKAENTNEDNKKNHSSNSNNKNKKPRAPPPAEPLFQEGEQPQKKFYRQRAHCNPLSHNDSFAYPIRPSLMDWTVDHYPSFRTDENNNCQPTVLDVGCGFGGLTMALGRILPKTTLILGLEIRAKVTEYVRLRIVAARTGDKSKNNEKNTSKDKKSKDGDNEAIAKKDNDTTATTKGTHHNVSVMRTNTQKFMPNFFAKQSLEKLFFCFPDPHFKRKNHPRRIISDRLLSEYCHLLQPNGLLYCITDVKELHDWHVNKCDAHPLLQRVPPEQDALDPCVQAMRVETEEGQKVERNKGSKYHAVYRRIDVQEEGVLMEQVTASNFFGSTTSASATAAETKTDK